MGKQKHTKQPYIKRKGKKYYVVGCKKCNSESQVWVLAFRQKTGKFIISCPFCGHIEKLKIDNIRRKPEDE